MNVLVPTRSKHTYQNFCDLRVFQLVPFVKSTYYIWIWKHAKTRVYWWLVSLGSPTKLGCCQRGSNTQQAWPRPDHRKLERNAGTVAHGHWSHTHFFLDSTWLHYIEPNSQWLGGLSWPSLKWNVLWCSLILYDTNMILYDTNMILYDTIWYYMILYDTIWYYMILYDIYNYIYRQ